MTFAGWTALPAGTPAATIASYRLWEAGKRRAEFEAALAAWAVPLPTLPAGYVDASASLAGDGATDDTAALQALLDGLAGEETLFFPAATYRIDGPVTISKAVALVGESGTFLDCSNTDVELDAGIISAAGSSASPLAGVSLYGIDIVGAGLDTDPTLVDAQYLDGFTVSYCRMHDAGAFGIKLRGCTGTVIEDTTFADLWYPTAGYGVAVAEDCDDTTIRRCYFTGRMRHGVTHGTGYGAPVNRWPKATLIEDCYAGGPGHNDGDWHAQAFDTHAETYGPITIRGCLTTGCMGGIWIRGCVGQLTVEQNATLDCPYGDWLAHLCYSDEIDPYDPADPNRTYIEEFGLDLGGPADRVAVYQDNIVTVKQWPAFAKHALICSHTNASIADNVLVYLASTEYPAIDTEGHVPTGAIAVTGNVYSHTGADFLLDAGHHATLVENNTYLAAIPVAIGPAAFTLAPAAPAAGVPVQFTDATEGTPPSWLWTFGDGATSTEQNPAHTFAAPGHYPVTLTAGGNTASQTVTVGYEPRTPGYYKQLAPNMRRMVNNARKLV